MRSVSPITTFGQAEFLDLCSVIFKDYIASADLGNPFAYSGPLLPIINVTEDTFSFRRYQGLHFNYNVMSHTVECGVFYNDLEVFQAFYFNNTPNQREAALRLLATKLCRSWEIIKEYILANDGRREFKRTNYVFMSNMDIDLTPDQYTEWLNMYVRPKYPKETFRVGTTISILRGIEQRPHVKQKYLSLVSQEDAFLIIPTPSGVQAVPFTFIGLNKVEESYNKDLCNILVRSDKRIEELGNALEEFNILLSRTDASEAIYHQFFLEHPVFLTGLSYRGIRSKVILEREDAGPLIPDFFLEPATSNLWDILEIKKPTARLVTTRRDRERFSSEVFDAVAQIRSYGAYFDDARHRKLVEDRYGIKCYRPRLAIVIGNRHMVDDYMLKDAQVDTTGVQVITFDDLIRKVQNIRDWLLRG